MLFAIFARSTKPWCIRLRRRGLVMIEHLSDYLTMQQFICGDDFVAKAFRPMAMITYHGGARSSFLLALAAAILVSFFVTVALIVDSAMLRMDVAIGVAAMPKCQFCGSLDHTTVSCFRRYTDTSAPQAHVAFSNNLSVALFFDQWFLDTGAMHHGTSDLTALFSSKEYHGPDTLHVGNGAGLRISNIGHVSIYSSSRYLSLCNVLHVPALTNSLLSVQRFAVDNNVCFEFHSTFFLVKDCVTKKVLLKGQLSGGLYSLSSQSPIALISSKALFQVWHSYLGHPHAHVLTRILKSYSVDRSSSLRSSHLCSACQLGKSARFALPRVNKSSSRVLDLLYTDIWGPLPLYLRMVIDTLLFSWMIARIIRGYIL